MPASFWMQLEEILKLLGFAGFGLGGDVQVRAVEAGGEDMGAAHVQRGEDVVAGARIGGGGQRYAGDAGEDLGEAFADRGIRGGIHGPRR